MGMLAKLSTTVSPARRYGGTPPPYHDWWYAPDALLSAMVNSGLPLSPELAMTSSAVYCAVMTIANDLSTLPMQCFKHRDDGGKDRVRPGYNSFGSGGIGSLAYRLRWQPNQTQTAVEFWKSMVVQLLIRETSYAEIVPGPAGPIDQLIPRHPDRITPERLPNGRLRFKLMELDGKPRYITQEEMFVIRGLSHDGITLGKRMAYAAQSISSGLALDKAAAGLFKTGFTSSMLATYTGTKDDEGETQLHSAISRFSAGLDNAFGVLLLNDEVKIQPLAIDMEKAQMKDAREFIIREVARWFGMPAHKLQAIMSTESYASVEVKELSYVVDTLRPLAVNIEQSAQRDLILAKDTYFTEILLEAKLRGDLAARSQYYERAIRNRWMRPSEARLRENMNPDPALDKLSEGDNRPGTAKGFESNREARSNRRGRGAGAQLRTSLIVYDNAVRVLRRERGYVEKLAKKHPSDVDKWKVELAEFYKDQAAFVANTMRLPAPVARAYANQHRKEIETQGVIWMQNEIWEREEAEELALLALEPEGKAA